MDNQKLIWIVLSVTIAAIIVLLGGLVLLKDQTLVPQPDEAGVGNTPMSRINAESYAFDYTRENFPLSGLEPTLEEDNVTTDETATGEAQDTEKQEKIQVTAEENKQENTKPKTVKPKATEKNASYSTRSVTPPHKTRNVIVKEYWIQAGSYKDRNKAELLNATLTDKGLTGRIMTRDVKGDTFFRVRIGPYSNKKEAEKFLSWIKALKGLENSYISEVSVKRKAVN
ncbi:MAG: SPOR domain-containing protein [Spirochaetia bacterium]